MIGQFLATLGLSSHCRHRLSQSQSRINILKYYLRRSWIKNRLWISANVSHSCLHQNSF